jgi:hypothetical protein
VVSEDRIRLIPLNQCFDPLGDVEQRNRIQPIVREVVEVNRGRADDLARSIRGLAAVVKSTLVGVMNLAPCANAIG